MSESCDIETCDIESSEKGESQQTSFYKGQNDRDWTEKTPLDSFLGSKGDDKQWLQRTVQMYENSEISYRDILDQVPKSTNWIWGVLPQFETFSNKNCLLFLGFCPQYAEVTPGAGIATLDPKQNAPFTELFLSAAARALETDAINLCVRKECRKSRIQVGRTYSNCRPISANESVRLFLATKLEIAVAQKEFGISFTTCIAFSNAAQEIARALSPPDLPIIDPSHLARSGNWALPLVTLGLQHMAKKLSEADGTDPRELYIKIRADLIRARPKWAYLGSYDGDPTESHISRERMVRIRAIEKATGIGMMLGSSIDELENCPSERQDSAHGGNKFYVPDSSEQEISHESGGAEVKKYRDLKYLRTESRMTREKEKKLNHKRDLQMVVVTAQGQTDPSQVPWAGPCECGDCKTVCTGVGSDRRGKIGDKRYCPACNMFASRNPDRTHHHNGWGLCECNGCISLNNEDEADRQVFRTWFEPHGRFYCRGCAQWYRRKVGDAYRNPDTHVHRGPYKRKQQQ